MNILRAKQLIAYLQVARDVIFVAIVLSMSLFINYHSIEFQFISIRETLVHPLNS